MTRISIYEGDYTEIKRKANADFVGGKATFLILLNENEGILKEIDVESENITFILNEEDTVTRINTYPYEIRVVKEDNTKVIEQGKITIRDSHIVRNDVEQSKAIRVFNSTDYALKSEMPNLSEYALKSDIPNTNDLVSETNLDEKLKGYAKTENIPVIPNLDSYLKAEDLKGYAKTESIPTDYLKSTDLEGYAKTKDIPTDYLKSTDTIEYSKINNTPDLSNFATKEELPELSGYALKTELPNLSDYVIVEQGKGLSTNDYTNEDKNKLNSLENYDDTALKQEIEENYAKKSELESISKIIKASSKEQAISLSQTNPNNLYYWS